MKKRSIQKILIKVGLQLLFLLLILLGVIAIACIPRDLSFTRVHGILTTNFDFAAYRGQIREAIRGLVTGEYLRASIHGRSETVGLLVVKSMGRSMAIFFGGLIIAFLLGIPKGILDSGRSGQKSNFKVLQTLIPLSLPDVMTISLVQLFAYFLYRREITFFGIGPILPLGHESWPQYLFPILAISLVPAAYIARITATSIESVSQRDYILTAKGKGCSGARIISKHMGGTILADLIAAFPGIAALMFSSLFVVEKIFYFKGMTYEMMEFYGRALLEPEVSIVYLTLGVALAFVYFILYTLLEISRNLLIPKLKE